MSIVKDFEAIGAKARVALSNRRRVGREGFTIDIAREKGEEIFDIRRDPNIDMEISVVDKRPGDRHLLLMVKTEERAGVPVKTKFLCGHDERHWFVASVNSAAADVPRAKESLKPPEVVEKQTTKSKKRSRGVRGGVRRQGEWFFIPMKKMKVPANQVLKNEPIRREGGSKPHIVEEVYRVGGSTVYEGRNGGILSAAEFRSLKARNPVSASLYRVARADARVFGRGKVRHPDHATVELSCWHQIVPNTEHRYSTRSLRFVD